MRRTGPRLAGAVVLAVIVLAVVARESAQPSGSGPLNLTAVSEDGVTFDTDPDDVRGYWGQITGDKTGNYRATCVGLGGASETRLTCNVVLSFTDGSSLIAQGLVGRLNHPSPGHQLFAEISDRQLVVTGGTQSYVGKQGYADLTGNGHIGISVQ